MPPKDGYGFDDGTLDAVAVHLSDAASQLDEGLGSAPGVDAGRTSPPVAATMGLVANSGVAFAEILDGMAETVVAGKGNYEDIENSNAGMLKWQELPPKDPHDPNNGPLMDAPDAVDNLDHDEPWAKR